MVSEKTLYTALCVFDNPNFRRQRQQEFPGTRPEYDARAAAFAVMDTEGRFDATIGESMTPEQDEEFEVIARAVLRMSK